MSSDNIVFSVKGVSKQYELFNKPSDQLKQLLLPMIQRLLGLKSKRYFTEYSALKDLSFDIKKGETVGVIGSNGSGKSTLLQILCGTLFPSSGSVKVNGRVAALLELGAGFNPDFTGRENVYMNAGILGLRKDEIDTRLDEIISFAEIGDFIDRPVKTYSSGMYVRLAFAVIAHVNADVLIIDEALAVGDALFTQKCMNFLRSFMKMGTVFFVSHDIPSVKNLCSRVIWLDNGQVVKDGNPNAVCDLYYQHTLQRVYGNDVKLGALQVNHDVPTPIARQVDSYQAVNYESKFMITDNSAFATGWNTGAAEITSITMDHVDGNLNHIFEGAESVRVSMRARVNTNLERPILGFIVKDRLGQELFGENTIAFTKGKDFSLTAGQEIKAEFIFRLPMLPDGQYVVMISLADGDSYNHVHHHYVNDALIFDVHSSRIRFGIVGVLFDGVSLEICDVASL